MSRLSRHPALAVVAAVGLVVGLLSVVGALGGSVGGESPDRGERRERSERPERPDRRASGTDAQSGRDRRGVPEPDPSPRTHLVVRIVDGDTLELGNGETVRLVGIDTPEAGECGFAVAGERLAALVLGQRVALRASAEDRDAYGRLLRYVDVGRRDAGLRLIRAGLADARYDSRDGYGRHPRERAYVAADRSSTDRRCAARPRPFAAPAAGCEPGYTPCVPPYPPDVDCADVGGPVTVTGPDPHGLDAEGDGRACE